jgi:hypothetical protein
MMKYGRREMKASPSESSTHSDAAIQAAEKGGGPSVGLIVAAVVHAGVLAWTLGSSVAFPPVVRLPFGNIIAAVATAALLSIFLIAAFARRGALSFVVVPAMVVAGVATHAVSSTRAAGLTDARVLAGVLAFGALSVAINLSFGAAAIAARAAPTWNQLRLGHSAAFRLGSLGLVAVFGVAGVSEQLAPLAALCALVGVVVLGAMVTAVERDANVGLTIAELVSAIALALAAIWAASIVAGVTQVALVPKQWARAQSAMTFAWVNAIPLVLGALVALAPRIVITGAGVKRGRSTVLATTIGAVTCIGLSQVVWFESTPLLSAGMLAASLQKSPQAKRTSANAAPNAGASGAGASKSSARGSAAAAANTPGPIPEVSPTVLTGAEVVTYQAEKTRVAVSINIEGPMLPRDARQGVEKSLKRLVNCYERSIDFGEPSEVKLALVIDDVGSVRQSEPSEPKHTDNKYVTCVQLAFYRSGFSAPTTLTRLELITRFYPKG